MFEHIFFCSPLPPSVHRIDDAQSMCSSLYFDPSSILHISLLPYSLLLRLCLDGSYIHHRVFCMSPFMEQPE